MEASPSRAVASFASELSASRIPNEVLEAGRLHFIDTVGVMCATRGFRSEFSECILRGVGPVGGDRALSPEDSAFVLGTLAHGVEQDDTYTEAVIHGSSVLVPAVIAAGQMRNDADGIARDLDAAIVAGYETMIAVGLALGPSIIGRLQPTTLVGVLGAAVAAARILGLDDERTLWALGMAGTQAFGLGQYLNDAPDSKAIHPGFAARIAVSSARLAGVGVQAPTRILEGERGLARLVGADPVAVWGPISELGTVWRTPDISYKPYQICHVLHSYVDAAKALRLRIARIEDVEEIVCYCAPLVIPILTGATHTPDTPLPGYKARFSLEYAFARTLANGDLCAEHLVDGATSDSQVFDLYSRVRLVQEDLEGFPRVLPAIVEVRLSDGRILRHEESVNWGHPSNPMSEDDLAAKFRTNVDAFLAIAEAEPIWKAWRADHVGEGWRAVLALAAKMVSDAS